MAFVAADSDRVSKPGIPSHIPIAYGMQGPSLQMSTMRNMVNDIRNKLKEQNTSVLCEVYDGSRPSDNCVVTRRISTDKNSALPRSLPKNNVVQE